MRSLCTWLPNILQRMHFLSDLYGLRLNKGHKKTNNETKGGRESQYSNTIQYNNNLFSIYDLQATIFQKKRYNNE